MAVGFGFSVGDLIAVGKLAHDIANALSDCRGASAEYRTLIELLGSLKTSLNLISNFVSALPVASSARVDQAFMNGILFHTGCCYKLLNEFAVDSRKYTQRLLNGRGAKAQIAFRKLKWSLYSADDSQRLERRLGTHMEAFDRYLLAINIQTETDFAHEFRGQVSQISLTMTAILDTVKTTQSMMPKMLGYPWEGDILSSHVHIEDVLGRSLVLPMTLCRTRQTLKDTMRIMFSDHPGLEKVVDGNFELVDKQNQLTIFDGRVDTPLIHYGSPANTPQPGAKLWMNILRVKTLVAPKASLLASVQILEACPRCGFATSGWHFRKCVNCDMSFKKSVQELYGAMPGSYMHQDWPRDFIPRTRTDTALPLDYGPAEPASDNIKTGYIRRVHEIAQYLVPDLPAFNQSGSSRLPLIQAVGQGDLNWVRQILLKTDTDPNTRSFQNWTALQQACIIGTNSPESRNQEAIVRLLISEGADVNAACDEYHGRTALQAACECGNEKIVDLLVEKGADVNQDGSEIMGRSALDSAVQAGHFGIVKKLLNLGADINQPKSDISGDTALSTAAQLGNLEILNLLIENGARTGGSTGVLSLKYAIAFDQLDVAQVLLENGVDVNSCVHDSAPLHSVKSIDMVKLLVTYGARFDLPGSEGSGATALQWAVRSGNFDLITELIRLGSHVHYPGLTKYGLSALQVVAFWCCFRPEEGLRIMTFLVAENGTDVNEPRSKEGYTSLEAACLGIAPQKEQSNIDCVKFLVEKGAVITPFTLHVAVACNHTELLDFLLQNGARIEDINSPVHDSAAEKPLGRYRELGPTVIETARLNGHMALVEILENWKLSTPREI